MHNIQVEGYEPKIKGQRFKIKVEVT